MCKIKQVTLRGDKKSSNSSLRHVDSGCARGEESDVADRGKRDGGDGDDNSGGGDDSNNGGGVSDGGGRHGGVATLALSSSIYWFEFLILVSWI
ncbi:unnamed protein product [Arabidopsis lyrata]|uniref:Predicted protein n=1 Tax=Arabidopsis lyrata subsp. lyrata TaxID=81972 RepID=D7MJH7_ARALL|nr:predicted protein [Arabidopsis lyrata subsp. lyrata]CAH8277562.1 unnamed protein product [Arabidopsis lyrata]